MALMKKKRRGVENECLGLARGSDGMKRSGRVSLVCVQCIIIKALLIASSKCCTFTFT